MALTAQQAADVRRFAGYPSLGVDTPADTARDFASNWVLPGVYQTLFTRLQNLTPETQNTLINVYLVQLYQLEQAILGAATNLDTESAAIWTRNKNEVSDRTRLFDDWRRRMCELIGLKPGPFLGQRGLSVARC
jgi:hypothetical protein